MSAKVVYGVRPVSEALRAEGRVRRIYCAKESRAPAVEGIVGQAKERGVRFDFVPQAKINGLAGTQEHQGVAAVISPVAYTPLKDFLAACPPHAVVAVLDQVQHPRNLGLLARAAVGAGAAGLIVSQRGGAGADEAAVQASAGALFHLPLIEAANTAQAIRTLQNHGFWVYGLDSDGAQSVFEISWADRSAIVLGNETRGLRPGVKKACDVVTRIPLAGGLDSLNVAVAGGIVLFQVISCRQSV